MDRRKLNSLLKKLRSDDPAERRSAADQLSAADERAVYPLLRALRDGNPGVQEAAMRSLIGIGGEVTAYMVLPLLREEALLRNTAMIILKEIGNVELLAGLLNDKDDDVRKFALDLMAEIGRPEACRYLAGMFDDPNPNVRAAAAAAAGRLGCRRLIPQLIKALRDEEWVSFSALEAIAELKEPTAVEAIAEVLENPSEAVRCSAIEALGRIGTAEAGAVLKGFIRGASGMERNIALKALVEIGLTPEMRDLTETLTAMLRSEDRGDVTTALKGLVSAGSHEAIPLIVDRAGSLDPSNPEDAELLSLFRESLLRLGAPERLMELLRRPGLRYRGMTLAIEVLGKMKCREAVPLLMELINSPVRDVRRAGTDALGELGNGRAVDSLLSVTDDPDGHVRKAAVVALRKIKAASAYDVLFDLLGVEPYMDVKEEIVRALIGIDEERFVSDLSGHDEPTKELIAKFTENTDVLLALSYDPSAAVRISAISNLGRVSSDRAVARIKEAASEPDPGVRKAAVQCMEGLKCCQKELLALLDDEDMWVRFYAVKALASLKDAALTGSIITMLSDPELPVVMGAIEALSRSDTPEAADAIRRLRHHPNPAVRERATEVVQKAW